MPDQDWRDIEAIKQLKARYFRFMDTKDWANFLGVFAEDARMDTSEAYTALDFQGRPFAYDKPSAPMPPPEWSAADIKTFVAGLSAMLADVSTVHHGHMPEITLTAADSATGIWAMEDKLRWPGGARHMHGYGHYHETYARTAGGWRIRTLKLTRVRVDIS